MHTGENQRQLEINKFEYKETLSINVTEKSVVVLGKYDGSEEEAILILTVKVPDSFPFSFSNVEQVFQNDIYWRFKAQLPNKVEIQFIYPITEKHKDKYREKKKIMIEQTEEMYQGKKKELLERELAHINWVNNIIEGKAEVQRVLIQNEKYTILPDFKFADLTDISSLHLLVIFADKELCSIRDLRENHIDLLEEVRSVVDDLLTTKFGMEKNSYRLYFHYPPTFYRLHIHVVSLKLASMGAIVDRAHLLSTIIANLKILPLYYKNMPIPIVMEQK